MDRRREQPRRRRGSFAVTDGSVCRSYFWSVQSEAECRIVGLIDVTGWHRSQRFAFSSQSAALPHCGLTNTNDACSLQYVFKETHLTKTEKGKNFILKIIKKIRRMNYTVQFDKRLTGELC